MAALDEIRLNAATLGPQEAIISLVKDALWAWIFAHDESTVTVRVWIFRKTFKIKDLHAVFELLLGPAPTGK